MSTTSINANTKVITLINVFQVEADRQQELIDLLNEATEKVMRYRPGFVSANIHAGLDGTSVANYAQWASVADFEAMLADPMARHHMDAATAIASAEPHLYTVVSTHAPYPDPSAQQERSSSRAL